MPEIIFRQSLKNELKKRVKGEIYVCPFNIKPGTPFSII